MYGLIDSIINHDWITQGASEQQYIYYISGAVIILTIVFLYDVFKQFMLNIFKR